MPPTINFSMSEVMQCSHPDTLGEIPPSCRAHTATLVDRKIDGQCPTYNNTTVYLVLAKSRAAELCQRPLAHSLRRDMLTPPCSTGDLVFDAANTFTTPSDVWMLDVSSLVGLAHAVDGR
jgi:hypothetical protein